MNTSTYTGMSMPTCTLTNILMEMKGIATSTPILTRMTIYMSISTSTLMAVIPTFTTTNTPKIMVSTTIPMPAMTKRFMITPIRR